MGEIRIFKYLWLSETLSVRKSILGCGMFFKGALAAKVNWESYLLKSGTSSSPLAICGFSPKTLLVQESKFLS